MEKFYVQRTWTPIPGLEKHAGTDKIEFKFPQGQTKGQKGNIYESCMQYPTPKNRHPSNKNHCSRESNILSKRVQNTNIRLDHHGTPCKQRHLRRQIKIHMHGRKIFLPE